MESESQNLALPLLGAPSQFHLEEIFDQLNVEHFEGKLERPLLRWNSRLRASAGRFFPGHRPKYPWGVPRKPVIELATYLREEERADFFIRDTMAHEMVHYWLWERRRPYGHGAEFLKKLREIGASRYNTIPRLRPYKYIYKCGGCSMEYKTRRRVGALACASCCKSYNAGVYHPNYRLQLVKQVF